MTPQTRLSVNDQVADAVVAIYCARVVPGLTLPEMAVIADLDELVVKRAYIRRMDLDERKSELRRCTRCGQRRKRDDFPKKRSSVDGLDKWCHTCCRNLATTRADARKSAAANDRKVGSRGARTIH